MTHYQRKFPIYREANRLVIEIEQAVRLFPRYHQYTLGHDMRKTAYDILFAITRAINEVDGRPEQLKKAHDYSEEIKIRIQLAKQITTMRFKLFEQLTVLAVTVSKQCKAWQKSLQRPHQNGSHYV